MMDLLYLTLAWWTGHHRLSLWRSPERIKLVIIFFNSLGLCLRCQNSQPAWSDSCISLQEFCGHPETEALSSGHS